MDWLRESLADLEAKGLLRTPPVIGPNDRGAADGRTILVEGERYLSFASNNYLGLAGDERVRQAAGDAARKFGAGAGASRLIVGTHSLHRDLEKKLAEFKGAEDCIVFTTGYQAGVGAVTSLAGQGDSVILDKLSHACLIDGARASGARVRAYPHLDMKRLEELLERESGSERRLIVTDSLFSMDGDIAPLAEILALAEKHDAMLLADEAHATGTLGPGGRGLVAELGPSSGRNSERLVQMGTLSKALGSVGGFVAGTRDLVSYLRNTARSYIYTTAPTPAAMAAALEALRIIETQPELIAKLRANVKRLAEACPWLFDRMAARTPIVPVMIGRARHAVRVQAAFRECGIWIPAVRPPSVPKGESRLRVSITAAHTPEDIGVLAEALNAFRRGLRTGPRKGGEPSCST